MKWVLNGRTEKRRVKGEVTRKGAVKQGVGRGDIKGG